MKALILKIRDTWARLHQSGTTNIVTMWQHASVPPDMYGAGPCSWRSTQPTLQLRDSTKGQAGALFDKMADGAPREQPHQHHF